MLVAIHLLQIPPLVLRVQQVRMAQGLLLVAAHSVYLAPTPLPWLQLHVVPVVLVPTLPAQGLLPACNVLLVPFTLEWARQPVLYVVLAPILLP